MMMKPNLTDPSAVSFLLSLYGLLLVTYPSGFRHEYGPHMAQVFRDCTLKSYRHDGLPGLLDLWIHTLIDYFKSVVEEHLQKGIHMSKEKFIRLSGWSFILGAITFLVAWLISIRDVPTYNPANFRSKPIDLYFEYASLILIPASMLFFMVGMIGLYLRYSKETNGFGRGGLILGIIGGVISFGGSILMVTIEPEWIWEVWMVGFILYFLGLVIFGIAAVRDKLLPRWNALPILTGIWFPLLIIVTSQMDWDSTQIYDLVGFLFTAIGLAGMGYLLQSDSQPASSEAGTI
jgi:hypothetical protein